MSLDRSLRTGSAISRHRNVLSRAERVARLSGQGKFAPEKNSVLGLPKVANRKVSAGGKAAEKKAAEPGAAAPAAGSTAAPAAAGKAPAAAPAAAKAAPAAGGKAGKAAGGKGK